MDMKNVVTPEILQKMKELRSDGKKLADIAFEVGIDTGTVSRQLRGIVRRAPSYPGTCVKKSNRARQPIPDDYSEAPNDLFFDAKDFPEV